MFQRQAKNTEFSKSTFSSLGDKSPEFPESHFPKSTFGILAKFTPSELSVILEIRDSRIDLRDFSEIYS